MRKHRGKSKSDQDDTAILVYLTAQLFLRKSVDMKLFKWKLICNLLILSTIVVGQNRTDQDGYKALFVKRSTLYTKITNGHLVMNIDLKVAFESRLEALDQLKTQFESAFNAKNYKNLPHVDQKEVKLVKNSLLLDTQLMKERIQEAQTHFQVSGHQLHNRPKRQLIAAAIGLAGGLIYSSITQNEAINVLKEEHKVIKSTVRENILKIAETKRDIQLLNKTTSLINGELQKIFIQSQSNTLKITLLSIQTLTRHYFQGCEEFLTGLSDSLSGRLTSGLVNLVDLKEHLNEIKNKAAQEGYHPAISSTLDIPNLPLTLLLNQTHLNLIVSIPMESPSSEFMLYEYVPTPIPFTLNSERHYMFIKPDKPFLAVNPIANSFIELDKTDLADCMRFASRYHCQSLIETSPNAKTCLMALFKNQLTQIKTLCPSYLAKHLIAGHRINNKYLFIDTSAKTIKTTYNISHIKSEPFDGAQLITVNPGSSVNTENLFLAKSPLDHNFGFTDLNLNFKYDSYSTDLTQLELLSQHDYHLEESIYQDVKKSLDKVGSKLPMSSVHRIIEFNKRLAKADAVAFWKTFSEWFIIGIIVILTITLFFLCRYGLCDVCSKSKTTAPTAADEQEMQSMNQTASQSSPTPLSDDLFEQFYGRMMYRMGNPVFATTPDPATATTSKKKKKPTDDSDADQ